MTHRELDVYQDSGVDGLGQLLHVGDLVAAELVIDLSDPNRFQLRPAIINEILLSLTVVFNKYFQF